MSSCTRILSHLTSYTFSCVLESVISKAISSRPGILIISCVVKQYNKSSPVSNIPSNMSLSAHVSISLSFWTLACLSHSVALAEYSVYREINPSTQADAEVCMVGMMVSMLPLLFTGPHPTQPVLSVYLGWCV